MKKTAIVIAAMMVMATFCTPVFAGEWYDGQYFNGYVSGQVGIFTPGNAGQFNGNNDVTGNGAIVDYRASNFHAEGWVGIFNGDTNTNTIKAGTGAYIGWSDNSKAYGTVGQFYSARFNTIDSAQGAVVENGTSNTANGQVGIFTGSHNNSIKNDWVFDDVAWKWVEVGSIGAYVEKGTSNTATGYVGLFTNAGSLPNSSVASASAGNTIFASQGAVILDGYSNEANGKVGEFVGLANQPTKIDLNTINMSTGAIISSGNNNTATGNVGLFYATNSAIVGNASGISGNVILSSTGAAIQGGDNNRAIGNVGVFNMSMGSPNHDNFFTGNTVQGTGAWIQGGNNNLAIGTVGQFNGGMAGNNKVTGTGAIVIVPGNR